MTKREVLKKSSRLLISKVCKLTTRGLKNSIPDLKKIASFVIFLKYKLTGNI